MNHFLSSCKTVLNTYIIETEGKMTQLNFTLDSDTVKGLFLTHTPDALVSLLETILNQFLQAMATEAVGARKYERTEECKAYRNGSFERLNQEMCR